MIFKHQGSQLLKRSLLLGAFCLLFACSDVQDTSGAIPPAETQALLTLSELLSADDVKQALAQASKENDEDAILLWQQRLLEAGEQVNLKTSEMNLIKGEQGKIFLTFQGMKTNYQNDFEQAFFNFEDVDAVYQRYPAFERLHEQSKELVAKRDALIDKVTATLIADGLSQELARQQAEQEWQKALTL